MASHTAWFHCYILLCDSEPPPPGHELPAAETRFHFPLFCPCSSSPKKKCSMKRWFQWGVGPIFLPGLLDVREKGVCLQDLGRKIFDLHLNFYQLCTVVYWKAVQVVLNSVWGDTVLYSILRSLFPNWVYKQRKLCLKSSLAIFSVKFCETISIGGIMDKV